MIVFELSATASAFTAARLSRATGCLIGDCLRDPDVRADIELAVTEACANVARHAYAGREPGAIRVELRLHPGRKIEILIRDWGSGFELPDRVRNAPPRAEHGRGLYIISELVDEFDVGHACEATVARLVKYVRKEGWKNNCK